MSHPFHQDGTTPPPSAVYPAGYTPTALEEARRLAGLFLEQRLGPLNDRLVSRGRRMEEFYLLTLLRIGPRSQNECEEVIRLPRLVEREVVDLSRMGRVMAEKVERVKRALRK